MTTPDERTRALRWAGEFLFELQGSGAAAALPDHLKRQIPVILRHYPRAFEIASEAKLQSHQDLPWLGLEGAKDETARPI
jgi:hypothetical protein